MSKKKERGEDSVLPDDSGTTARAPGAPSGAGTPGASASAAAAAYAKAAAGGDRDAPRPAARPPPTRPRGRGRRPADRPPRAQADFDNFRKRTIREREDAARYANAALLSDLLTVVDDFERAIRSAEESRDFAVFLQGVSMIERGMLEMLESRWGLKRFSAVGEPFDPVRHEAMMRTVAPAAPGAPTGPVVAEEFQKGYYLHERVLRPAKVRVQVPAEPPAAAPPAGTAGATGAGEG
jgi:molecular chaperone GrpE